MNKNNRQSQHIVYPELTNKDLLYPPLISDTQFPLPSMKEALKRMQYPGVGYIYSRLSHPTSMHLESVIARIEGSKQEIALRLLLVPLQRFIPL